MPPKSVPTPEVYPRLGFTVCGSPAKTGVSWELAARIRSALEGIGCGDLLNYAPPMNWVDAVTLMGAEWETSDGEFGDDYLFLDRNRKRVRCKNNPRNRPLTMSTVESRVADILNARWELNGETGVVGRDATVLDFQHTCVALILAYQDWLMLKSPETGDRVWSEKWPPETFPDGPVIEKCLVYGIDPSDRVVNTINTGRPRSLSDVFYRCPYFASLPTRSDDGVDRVTASKVAAQAIRVCWHRTGMYVSQFSSILTHSEACTWLEAHGGAKSKLLEAVRVVLGADKEGAVSRYVSLGYAAAMCWLMGQWETPEKRVGEYYGDDVRDGKRLKWTGWDRAVMFWSHFGTQRERTPRSELSGLTRVLDHELKLSEDPESGPRTAQKDYAIVTAWRRFRDGRAVDRDHCKVTYTRPDARGKRSLNWSAEEKTVGGIDLGNERIASGADDEFVYDPPDPVEKLGVSEVQVEESKVEESKRVDDRHRDPPVPVINFPMTHAAAFGVRELLKRIRSDHPEFGSVLIRTPKGDYAAWDTEINVVERFVTKKPRMHPKGVMCLTLRPDEVEVLCEHLTDSGLSVALVEEVVAPVNGDPRYTVLSVVRPGGKS